MEREGLGPFGSFIHKQNVFMGNECVFTQIAKIKLFPV